MCVLQEVAKRTTTYKTVVEEQDEDDDDNGVEAIEEDLFHQQVRLQLSTRMI